MTLRLDPPQVREVIQKTRTHADAIRDLRPSTGPLGSRALGRAADCELARTVGAIGAALNRVLTYHADRLDHFADLANDAVADFEQAEAERVAFYQRVSDKDIAVFGDTVRTITPAPSADRQGN